MVYQGKDVLELMKFAKNYNNFLRNLILRQIKNPQDNVLDFGSGCGTLAKALKSCGVENITCLEIDEELKAQCKDFTCVSSLEEIGDKSFDLIYSSNVLEHIEKDWEISKQFAQKLKSGGKIVLYLPAFQILFSSFDKKVGHFRRYDKKMITELFPTDRFRIKTLMYQDFIGFLLSLFYKMMNRENGRITKAQILIFDKLIFPISRFFDVLTFGKLFGKNIFAVIEVL